MIIGIDHGNDGGLCILTITGKLIMLIPMPTLQVIRQIAQDFDASIWIEELSLHPKFSRTCVATMARNLGRLEGHFRAYQRRLTTVRPQEWQKVMYDDPRLASLEGKKRSIAAAQILEPGINLRASPRCKKPHDGMADAYLIAMYGLMHTRSTLISDLGA